MGVYDHPPPPDAPAVTAMELPEAVPLIGLDSTRVLRQMSQLTRLRDALQAVFEGFQP